MSIKTEKEISLVKETFEKYLSEKLSLTKISSPIFLDAQSGVQDNLNGIERPIRFAIKKINGKSFEVIHSLAKWKRMRLSQYQVPVGEGIYTDMKALRPDEETLSTGIHSVYVDQWDWEKTISLEDRHIEYLMETVRIIYDAIKTTELAISQKLNLEPFLPDQISFIHTEELIDRYPDLSPKDREDKICQEKKAVFLIGIGKTLSNGQKHDGRAPDYDDWSTETRSGYYGLNGDVLVWNPVLKRAFEISSMGIRVDKQALLHQLEVCDCMERLDLPWHQMLMNDQLPQSIGGGIGQSRLTMLLLQKYHIGEVQVSAWLEEERKQCEKEGMCLL